MDKKIRVLNTYRHSNVYKRFFVYSFIITLIPFMLSLIIFAWFYNYKTTESVKNEAINGAIKSTAELETAINVADNIYIQFSENKTIYEMLNGDGYSVKHINDSAKVYDLFNKTINISSYIDSIYIFDENKQYVYSSQNSNYINNFSDRNWYEYYISNKQRNFMVCSEVEGGNVFSRVYQLLEYERPVGLLIVNISFAGQKNGECTILTADGEPLFGYDATDKAKYERYKGNGSSLISFHENDREVVATTVGGIYSLISEYEKNSSTWLFALIIIISFTVSLGAAAVFAFRHANYYYRSIADIVMQIKGMTGIPTPIAESTDELEFIKETVFQTITEKDNTKNLLIDKMIELNKMQAAALQSQINPHFLFNTLNLINGFILRKSDVDCEATMLISLLSEIFEFVMDNKDSIVPLYKEIEYAKKYVEIEMIKKNKNFDVEWDVEPETVECKVIKMILQPIIENAMYHGIRNLIDKRGVISIKIYHEADKLMIKVNDNGLPLSKESIDKINGLLSGDGMVDGGHIGLANVNRRIRLIYGEEYGCSFESGNRGSECTIKLPFETE